MLVETELEMSGKLGPKGSSWLSKGPTPLEKKADIALTSRQSSAKAAKRRILLDIVH